MPFQITDHIGLISKKEMIDIWEHVKTVEQAITDMVAQIKSKGDDVAKRFTSIDLVSTHYLHEGIIKQFLFLLDVL